MRSSSKSAMSSGPEGSAVAARADPSATGEGTRVASWEVTKWAASGGRTWKAVP